MERSWLDLGPRESPESPVRGWDGEGGEPSSAAGCGAYSTEACRATVDSYVVCALHRAPHEGYKGGWNSPPAPWLRAVGSAHSEEASFPIPTKALYGTMVDPRPGNVTDVGLNPSLSS